MSYHISSRDVFVAEFRILPFRRLLKDRIYWVWVRLWLWLLPPMTALTYVPFMAGCQGYFEIRDGIEYPQLGRWYSLRWARWRNRTYGARS
jgi:hypothetical protein